MTLKHLWRELLHNAITATTDEWMLMISFLLEKINFNLQFMKRNKSISKAPTAIYFEVAFWREKRKSKAISNFKFYF